MTIVSGHGDVGFQACPTAARCPVPENWMDFTLPIAWVAFCKTVLASWAAVIPASSANIEERMKSFYKTQRIKIVTAPANSNIIFVMRTMEKNYPTMLSDGFIFSFI